MSDVVNGALTAEPATEDRHAFAPGIALTVKPDGVTACFRRTGIKWPGGRNVVALVGKIDDVYGYCHIRDGVATMVLTKQEMAV